jgi:hypothetical protein
VARQTAWIPVAWGVVLRAPQSPQRRRTQARTPGNGGATPRAGRVHGGWRPAVLRPGLQRDRAGFNAGTTSPSVG